jgi:hypothetical protein
MLRTAVEENPRDFFPPEIPICTREMGKHFWGKTLFFFFYRNWAIPFFSFSFLYQKFSIILS